MTTSAVVYADSNDSVEAGTSLGNQIAGALDQRQPDALILFASSQYDYPALLRALDAACHPRLLVGCSSAGEFISNAQGEGSACAIALCSDEIQFSAGIGRGLRENREAAAVELISSFRGLTNHNYIYHSALVLTDALAGQVDDFVEKLTLLTAGTYQFFGGGAGDDARFQNTHVFFGTEAYSDAAVALEILSNKPVGIGVAHGWQPASDGMRVTSAAGMCLLSVNAVPAVEMFEEHAEQTGQQLDPSDPLPFFLHNVIGIDSNDAQKLRVPLGINGDGSVPVAADVPSGATIRIMSTTGSSSADAAARATRAALEQLQGYKPEVALFFDCVATRLRLGREFGGELQALQQELGSAQFAGFNSYGQIARAEGQFSGFHNCTAVVCVIPE